MPSKNGRSYFLATALSLSLAPLAATIAVQPAMAQSDSAQIEEVTVTARKVSENIQTTPVSVTALSGQKLADQSIVRLEELSSVVPNLLLTESSSAGTGALVYIRGVGSNSSSLYADSPVAVYINGVLIPHGAGLSFDLPDTDRVEVLRGPQGTLFGRNTTGGAVNIFTSRPTDEFGGSQSVSYGSYDRFITQTVLNTGELGDSNVRAKFTFTHDQNDGFARAPGYSRSDWGGSRKQSAFSGELLWTPNDNLSIDYRFDWAKSRKRPYAQFAHAEPTPLAYYSQSPTYGGAPFLVSKDYIGVEYLDPRLHANKVDSFGHALTIDYTVSDALHLKSISAYRRLRQHLYPQFMGSDNLLGPVINPANPAQPIEPVGPFVNVGQPGHQWQMSEELQASGTLGDINYVAGFFYFREMVDEYLPADITFVLSPKSALQIKRSRKYKNSVNSYAGYAQVSYRPAALDRKLEVTGGIRYTEDNKRLYEFNTTTLGVSPVSQRLKNKWTNLSGSGSVSYQWTPEFMTYARVANAYKAGGYNPGSLQPAYAPEKAVAYEIGWKSEWLNKRLRVNGSLFDTEYTNMQISQFDGTKGASQITNAAKARFRGVELELTALIGENFQVDGTLGYVDPKFIHYYNIDALGNPVDVASQTVFPGVSKLTGNIGAAYHFPHSAMGDFRVRVDYAYRGSQVAYPLASLNPYARSLPIEIMRNLNASLTWASIPLGVAGVDFEAKVFGSNLLNQHRRIGLVDFGSSLGIASSYYDVGRTFGVKLSAEF